MGISKVEIGCALAVFIAICIQLASIELTLHKTYAGDPGSVPSEIKLHNEYWGQVKLMQCPFLYTENNKLRGCVSPESNTYGVMYGIFTEEDLETFISDKGLTDKYVLVVSLNQVSRKNFEKIIKDGRTTAVIIAYRKDMNLSKPEIWSPMEKSPNYDFGLYKNSAKPYEWNTYGTNLAENNYNIYVSILTDSSDKAQDKAVERIKYGLADNMKRKHRQYPLSAIQVKRQYMGLNEDQNCFNGNKLIKGLCAPHGGQSVWGTFSNNIRKDDKKPIIFINSKIDSVGLVNTRNFGSEAYKSTLTLTLSIANHLKSLILENNINISDFKKHVVFGIFHSEFYGFSGSKRFVNNIYDQNLVCQSKNSANNSCPIPDAECSNPCFYDLKFTNLNFDNIDYIIETDQIANLYHEIEGNTANVYIHVHSYTNETLELAKRYSGTYSINTNSNDNAEGLEYISLNMAFQAEDSPGLPPSSAMAFLEKNTNIPTILLSPYREHFTNPYYYSFVDSKQTWSNKHSVYWCSLVDLISRKILTDIVSEDTEINYIPVDCSFVNDLFSCFVNDIDCPLIKKVFPDVSWSENDKSSSGAFTYKIKTMPYIVNRLLTLITSHQVGQPCVSDKDCNSDYVCSDYTFSPSTGYTGLCHKGMAYYHPAYSPGIDYDYEEKTFIVKRPELGTWATVNKLDIKTYFISVSSERHQRLQLLAGITSTLCCIVIAAIFKRFLAKVLLEKVH